MPISKCTVFVEGLRLSIHFHNLISRMQRLFSAARSLGGAALVAGVVSEFCLYDGMTKILVESIFTFVFTITRWCS